MSDDIVLLHRCVEHEILSFGEVLGKAGIAICGYKFDARRMSSIDLSSPPVPDFDFHDIFNENNTEMITVAMGMEQIRS